MSKCSNRERRVRRSRSKVFELNTPYLSVHRTPKHIYAQVFSEQGKEVLASASSLEPGFKAKKDGTGKVGVAETVGQLVAERAKAKGVGKVAFERSGYRYHGRVKALAEAARAGGLIS